MEVTQERLKELLDYNPDTGVFTWKVDRGGKAKKGHVAGNWSDRTRICVDGKRYLAHRLAFVWMEGYMPEQYVVRVSTNEKDKWENLKELSPSCSQIHRSTQKNNKSGITGISWHKKRGKWRVRISTPKKIYIGLFINLIDAAKARWEAEVKYGFPNCNTTSSAYMYLKEKGAI